MDKYLLIHEYTCPVCEGEGHYYNERWAEANQAYDKAHAAVLASLPETETEDAYYSGLGQATEAGWAAMKDVLGYDEKRWPPEEIQCPDCEGEGTIREEVELGKALDAIGIVTRLHY